LRERVVVLTRPDLRLEDVLKAAVIARWRRPLHRLLRARGVRRNVVDAVHLFHPVDRTRARRRGARACNAEPLAGFVELQVVIDRLAVVEAVHVADAVFATDVELDTFLRAAALRLDDDDAVRGRAAVQRRACRTLHDFDRLDIEAAHLVETADVHDDAVNDDQWLLASTGRIDRPRAT